MSEATLYNDILRECSHSQSRLLRINAGRAYQGKVIERTPHRIILSPWYPIRLAAEGVSDLLGWTTVNMGEYGAQALFTAIECKYGRGGLTAAQSAFLELVRRSGGRAGVARSVEDAAKIIRGET